jgi:hypothetical protein
LIAEVSVNVKLETEVSIHVIANFWRHGSVFW